jgi:hypothetical protein
MAILTSKKPSATYKSLLQVGTADNQELDSTLRVVEDGAGNDSPLKISTSAVVGTPLYAYFGVNYADFSALDPDTHYAVPFTSGGLTATNDVDFGGSGEPATTFTTADTDTQYASQIVPMMWWIPDDITIDSVTSIEGADNATGETTRMHLYSYHFTPGSTSCLTSGALIAHNSDVTNAGNEQAYLSSWTIDTADINEITGSKVRVILCFFRSDTTVSSDYSLNVTVKYHLR